MFSLKSTKKKKDKGRHPAPRYSAEKSQKGTVIAIGSGKMLDNGVRTPFEVKVGDRVLLAKYSGVDIEEEGENYLLLSERDILAIL